jgi:PAS domain S-box-containing protein
MIINMYETLTRRITVILLIISLSVFLSGAAADNTSTPPKKRVLILNSYHKGLSWTDNIVHGIEAELKADGREIEIYSEYMDTKRYPGKEHYRNLYETYSYKFKKYKFDIVIVSDNNALNFVIKYHGEIFPDTPVVFCGINNFQESMLTGLSLFTGVVEEIDISGTLELALALHPDTERVVSINDETTTGIAVKNEVLEIAPQFEGWVDFEFIENFNIAELKEQVWKLPRNSIILLSVVNRDRSGQFFAYEESIAHIYSESSAPIYSFWDTYLGKGIVGGRLTTGYHQGKTAAQIALRILNGADVKTIPVVRDSPNKYMFDHQQLKLFNISESGLPQDSIIINVPDTLYSRNKTLFLSGLFTISSLIMIIGVLLIMMSYRKKMEAVLRDSEQRYRDFYENAPDMYHSINKDGTVIDCNETEARMLGYKKEEIIGRPVSDFFTEKTKKIYEKEFPDLKNRSVHLDVEREFVRRDGSTFTASLNISTEIDENGELIKTKTIARDLTERRRVEELKKSQEQLRSLSAHLESAREKEKKRIARQIHDELGHVLTTLSLDLSWLNNRLSNKSEAFDTDLIMDRTQAMSDLIESTVQTVQRISSELIPGVLDHLGLAEAIKWQTDKFRARTGITYNVIIDSDRMMLDQQSSIAVFRIFQETLTNIARHAEATEVTVALQEEDDIMTLEISDNGIGIQDSQISSPESVGLIGIRERARILGGKASISGSPNGTSVKLVIPINGTKGDE